MLVYDVQYLTNRYVLTTVRKCFTCLKTFF